MDQAAIKEHCLALNAGELYPLLACIVTGRPWKSIQNGISNKKMTKAEVMWPFLSLTNFKFPTPSDKITLYMYMMCVQKDSLIAWL